MKINTDPSFSGSFGIPPKMREAEERFREEKAKAQDSDQAEQVVSDFDFGQQDEGPAKAEQEELMRGPITPEDLLKKIGVELGDDDFQKLFFRGHVEKEVTLFPARSGQKPFTVTMKTLTGLEYDEVDELMADDVQALKMTNEGYSTRRNMWTLCFAVSHLAGKPVCKPVMKQLSGNEVVDLKETAKKRREVLSRLSGSVISKMMRVFGTLSVAINDIVENPESGLIKKP